MLYCVVEAACCQDLSQCQIQTPHGVSTQDQAMLHRLFRVFVAFCICIQISLKQFSVVTILSFLEYRLQSNVSVHMIVNYVSALKAISIIYSLPHDPFDHPQVKYFIRSIMANRPLMVSRKNIMDIPTLTKLVDCCLGVSNYKTFKAMFLTAFFRLSNLAPHEIREFDPRRHFTGGWGG